jgi:hypothetical protein
MRKREIGKGSAGIGCIRKEEGEGGVSARKIKVG